MSLTLTLSRRERELSGLGRDFFQLYQCSAFADHVAFATVKCFDRAGVGGADAVLHLHGFQYHQGLAGFHGLAGFDQYADDTAVHGGRQPAMLGVAGFGLGDRVDAAYLVQATLPFQIERIALADRPVRAA